MLTELCKELNNWFDTNRFYGEFVINDNTITGDFELQENQYFRIVGSVFNDGIYQNDSNLQLTDETFNGAIWAMAIPTDVIALDADITAWKNKYNDVDSPAMSPFNSESFGGYSYSKGSTYSASGSSDSNVTWQGVFVDRLNGWRKIRCRY